MSKKDSKEHGIDRYHHMDDQTDAAEQLTTIYADWADTYDDDNDNKLGTVSQPSTVALLSKHCKNKDIEILDVGCGTGLVGHHLKRSGFETFDGTDISEEMMRHAKTRGYRKLFALQAGSPLPVSGNSYDATLCVGVFTHGHLGPEGIDELLRVTKPGGILCFTVNEGVWEISGFDKAVEAHNAAGDWQVLEQVKQGYMVNEGVEAWYVVARKVGGVDSSPPP